MAGLTGVPEHNGQAYLRRASLFKGANLISMPSSLFQPGGKRSDYRCEQRPLGRGGYAEVFRATHRASGSEVALKRLRKSIDETVPDRMRREVKVMRALDGEPHVMPILDFSPKWSWYVMPLAEGDANALRADLADPARLIEMLRACISALTAAHEVHYVHRDITPHNILRLPGGVWVLADWGLARARPGHTTTVLTSSGKAVGTEGFVAPEVVRGTAKGAEPAADVYSLGRVAAWAVSGIVPLAGQGLIPPGPFRGLIRAATKEDPSARPSLSGFSQLLDEVDLGPPPVPGDAAVEMVEAGREGEDEAWQRLLALGLENVDDPEVILDHLPAIPQRALSEVAEEDPADIARLAEAMREQIAEGFGERSFSRLDRMLGFVLRCCKAAVAAEDLGLLEDCTATLCQVEVECHQFNPRHETRKWLESLRGEAARTVARVLRANPDAMDWYTDEGWKPGGRTDRDIRSSLALTESH
ncbi:MAG TPA: serine/threonine-protein kinase [Solirubrobacterales bacterium]|nr:serine/threonine-protein kinase [Solirubrobacterales bacterium]